MKKVNWETYKSSLDKATQWKRDLVYSSELYDFVQPELLRLGVQINPTDTLLPISYHILGLLNTEEVLAELSSLKIPDVYNFLNNVIKHVTPKEGVQRTSQGLGQNFAAEIVATEHDLESLQNIRTMPNDIEAIQARPPIASENVYQSSQADILRPTPKTQADTVLPRWGSETRT